MIMYDPENVYSNIKVTIGTQARTEMKKMRGHQHVAYETYQRTPTHQIIFEVLNSSTIGCSYYIKNKIFEKGRRKKKEATSGIRTYHHNRDGMGGWPHVYFYSYRQQTTKPSFI